MNMEDKRTFEFQRKHY